MKKAFLLFIISALAFACVYAGKAPDGASVGTAEGASVGTAEGASVGTAEADMRVDVPERIMYNGDSLLYYARAAYLDDDAKGLFITAAAAYLRRDDPRFPDSCTTVSIDEAEVMLLRAAELGYGDACRLIRCLNAHGCWTHTVPQP